MILASFPIYSNPEIAKSALESLKPDPVFDIPGEVDLFIVVNNPLYRYVVQGIPHVINRGNNYCNGAWNQAMKYFLDGEWDYLAIGSSDVIMGKNWHKMIPKDDNEIWVPTFAPSLEHLRNWRGERKELKGGVAGAFTVLPRKAVELVYPIPKKLKLWFGDEYMYGKLRENGWKIMQAEFTAYHYGSLSIQTNPESARIIEEDKIEWRKYCTGRYRSQDQNK